MLARARWLSILVAVAAVLAMPAVAFGHTERASYWPDPAPDCSVDPCAGGAVPTARSLESVLTTDRRVTRVVCRPDSFRRAQRSIANAEKKMPKIDSIEEVPQFETEAEEAEFWRPTS